MCRSKAHRDSRKGDKKVEKKEQNPGIRCSHCGRDDFGQDGMALRFVGAHRVARFHGIAAASFLLYRD